MVNDKMSIGGLWDQSCWVYRVIYVEHLDICVVNDENSQRSLIGILRGH